MVSPTPERLHKIKKFVGGFRGALCPTKLRVIVNNNKQHRKTTAMSRIEYSYAFEVRKKRNNKKRLRNRFDQLRKYKFKLEQKETEEERQLFHFITNLGLIAKKQWIIGNRIVDIFIPEYLLVIEADGSQHYTPEGIAKDKNRTEELMKENRLLKILRYKNSEITEYGFEEKLRSDILKICGIPKF